ncbi:MAG: pyridoxal phosphate-dependent aminotransferase [Candidatus Marinimicrobia bacterium]|nr:pyridoxal phosphate-dependent aminotransferase [Candidatus Neomarinimicrobiota bacterium]
MIKFADRVARVKGSVTLEMTAVALQLRNEGKDVLNLSAGEPDFDTPRHIVEAGKKAMDDGFTRYTPAAGLPQTREAVTAKLKRDNNIDVTPAQVIVSNGAKHALFNACMALFQEGDEVIIFAPYWVSFPEFVHLAHATPVILGSDPESNFEPHFDELAAAITPRTRGIIINSPSNPTGGVWSREAIEQTIALARESDLWIFSDECYERLTYDAPFESTASIDPAYEKILTFQSCSKTYAMTGWRMGYMAGPVEVVNAMAKIQGQSTSSPNAIAQIAAIAALTGDQGPAEEMKAAFKRRRELMVDRLSAIPGISCGNPGGAFYVFLNVEELFGKQAQGVQISSPRDVSAYLLKKYYVVTVSGEGFGDDKHIRLSYALADEDIIKATGRIAAAVSELE